MLNPRNVKFNSYYDVINHNNFAKYIQVLSRAPDPMRADFGLACLVNLGSVKVLSTLSCLVGDSTINHVFAYVSELGIGLLADLWYKL